MSIKDSHFGQWLFDTWNPDPVPYYYIVFCDDGVELFRVECVEKLWGWIVHELNVSEVVCVWVEWVGVEKVMSWMCQKLYVSELNVSGWKRSRVGLFGVESRSWINRSGVVPLPLYTDIFIAYGTNRIQYIFCRNQGTFLVFLFTRIRD
jgi:hypothetical protein